MAGTSGVNPPPDITTDSESPPTLQLLRRKSNTGRSQSPRLPRRRTTQDRIDDILEIGRQRAESMPGQQGPRRSPLPRTTPSGGVFAEEEEEEEDGPDETTGIVMKGPNGASAAMNYQTTADPAGARPRKTATTRNGSGNSNDNGTGNGHEHNRYHENDFSEDDEKWWKKTVSKFQSIELENKGSVARDHLALERTFLAWLRTSLAFASIGVAITQLFRLNTTLAENSSQQSLRHLGKPLGAIFLGISILILFLGYHRYFQAQQWIIKGKFPASRGTIILVSMVAFILMVISLVVVVVVQPSTSSSG